MAAAKAVGESLAIRPKEGEMVLIPRFRETEHGREEAGRPVPLAVEFVPNPLATICLAVDEKSDRVIESPRGLLIVDTSYEGAEDLHDLWNGVIVLHYSAESFLPGAYEEGFYVGRLLLSDTSRSFLDSKATTITAFLQYISANRLSQTPSINVLPLGNYTDPESMRGLSPDDQEGFFRRWEEIKLRARSKFRLLRGIRILGKVIGRLTGHLEVSAVKKAEVQE
jgi:hypothetical protein